MKLRASSPLLAKPIQSRPGKRRPKRFLRKLVNYLKYDSYMYAPIISSSSSSKIKHGLKGFHENPVGVEIGGRNKKMKRLEEIIGEYLTSDSYMYAPLIEGVTACPLEGTPCLTKRVTNSAVKTVLTMKTTHQPTEESRDAIEKVQTQPIFDSNHEMDNGRGQTPKKGEVLKQAVFPSCCKSLLSESDFLGSDSIAERVVHRRKIPVE